MQCCHFGEGTVSMGHFVKACRSISYYVLHNTLHICALHKTAKYGRGRTQVSTLTQSVGHYILWDMTASAIYFLLSVMFQGWGRRKKPNVNRLWLAPVLCVLSHSLANSLKNNCNPAEVFPGSCPI